MANKIFNTDKRIKLGVWGLGRGGDLIACCKALNIDVVAGCDFNEHIRENFRKHAPDVFLTADEDEFLAQDMDAVLVATWFMDHAKHSIKALNAGKHVMCEVTSFYTPAEAVALVEAVEKSGKVYNLLENYPFMKPNMIAKKLWDDGLFGEFLYGEYDYNHDCRVLSYAYIDGTPVQPGWAVHNWRSWFNGHYYCTHSLGPLMYVTGLRPVQVSAPKLSIPLPGWVNDFRHTPSVSFVTMNNGGIFRNFMGSMTLDSHSRKIWGTRAAYDFTEDCLVSIGARGDGRKYVLKPEWPEMGDLAETMGHGGGDFWELYYFAREILTGEKAFWDVYRACDVCMTGLMAVRSQAQNGAPIDIPDFRDKNIREKYRNDNTKPEQPDTDNLLFGKNHDHEITGNFTTVMTKLIPLPWGYPWGGTGLVRSVFDGMKLYPDLKRPEDKLDVIRNVRTLIAELPELVKVYRDALKIADAYPDSLGARILRESLSIGEPEAILNTEQTLRELQEWLIRKSDPC